MEYKTMHAPHGPATGSPRPDADGRGARPRLTLRGGTTTTPRRAARLVDTETEAEPDTGNGGTEGELDWRAVALFGAGLAVGALLGAGAALLLAPSSGFETRMRLARNARRAGERANDQWDAIGDRVRQSARRSRRGLERKIIRARWRAQDAWERKRYGDE
jgi:hypothetical protein